LVQDAESINEYVPFKQSSQPDWSLFEDFPAAQDVQAEVMPGLAPPEVAYVPGSLQLEQEVGPAPVPL